MGFIQNSPIETPIEAVLFDFDNTLLPTDQLRQQLSEQVIREMGVENVVPGCCSFLIGLTVPDGNSLIEKKFKINAVEFRERRNYLESVAIESKEIKPYPFVPETLKYVFSRQIPTAIVTQSRSEKVSKHFVERRLFGDVTPGKIIGGDVVTEQGKRTKPFPDPYLLAAEELKIAPESCLVIEDSDSGIQSAISAGMQTLWFNNHFHPLSKELLDKVNYIADSFEFILNFIRKKIK